MLRSSLALARARALTTTSAAVVIRRAAPRAAGTVLVTRPRTYATAAPAATSSAVNYEPAKEAKHLKKVLIANR
jgi:hypothetical protein